MYPERNFLTKVLDEYHEKACQNDTIRKQRHPDNQTLYPFTQQKPIYLVALPYKSNFGDSIIMLIGFKNYASRSAGSKFDTYLLLLPLWYSVYEILVHKVSDTTKT